MDEEVQQQIAVLCIIHAWKWIIVEMCCSVLTIQGANDQSFHLQIRFPHAILICEPDYFCNFSICSHFTEASNICFYRFFFFFFLNLQLNSILSLCLIPTYPVQSSCVLKGWLYSLLLYDFTKLLLPAFEEGKSWPKLSDPRCKPHSGQDLSQSHHQDSSLPFISIHILPAPWCNWKKFMSAQQIFSGHYWGAHSS